MKKIFSLLSIVLMLNNILIFSVFAAVQIELKSFQIMINYGTNYTGDVEVYPGDKLSMLFSSKNSGDAISNPKFDFTFSSTNFSYNPTPLKTYVDSTVINENILTASFNPGVVNSLMVAPSAVTGDYLNAYFVELNINQDTPDNVLTIGAKMSSDTSTSNQISRNIFINTNPHIIDYYFENSGVQNTQLTRLGVDNIDLIIKVKDYNGCDNIDNGTVTANLTALGLSSSESLIYDSCSSDTAKYKKSAIATIMQPGTVSFSYSDFTATDESGNVNKPNDSSTTFDDEDKKTDLNLEIVSAGAPTVSFSTSDNYIGGTTNLTSNLDFSANQDGDYKLIVGSELTCTSGTILIDWTSYLTGNNIIYPLNSSSLTEGDNSIVACLKNDESLIGSFNLNIVKDTTNPVISTVSIGPANVVSENSTAGFTCSENGTFTVEKGGSGILNTGASIGTGSVISGELNHFTILNSEFVVLDNDFYLYCLDNASNYVSSKISVHKTTPPPSFVGEVTSFSDNDIDYDGLDGRDILVSWNNAPAIAYDFFESYRIYVLPSNVTIDEINHTYIGLEYDNTINSFTGDLSIVKDSLGNDFVSGSNYQACVTIMGSNGILGTPGCSTATVLTSDTVINAIVTGAKFTTDTNLEITTDATLDTNTGNHDASLILFTSNSTGFVGSSISSIDGNKVNVTMSSLGDKGALGTNLLISTGALRAAAGGFNDNQTFLNITDGQTPGISGFANNTTSTYNNFYTGSINLSYTFDEDMKHTDTKFEIIRLSGNLDSTTHIEYILGADLLVGTNNIDIDLDSLSLVDGTNYQVRLVGADSAGNYNYTNYITNIKYDNVGPDLITQNITALYSTLTPELTWNIPLDNNGNGSGIKEYNISIFNGNNCVGTINQTNTVITNSNTISAVGNIADYSWKAIAIDNMGNTGTESVCSNFRVDTSIPVFSNSQIEDTTITSTGYVQQSNNVEITSTITDTDIDHIWIDLTMLTGTGTNSNELCSTPSAEITCSYVGNLVTYGFTAGTSISDGIKQVQFNVQNTSGGNDVQEILSITSDSNAPVIDAGVILTPAGVVGGTGTQITWDTLKINDTIGLDYIQIEYSTGASVWNTVGTGINNGVMDWNLNSISSGNDYKIRLTAFDGAGNSSNLEGGVFEVDRTNPVVSSNTLINPNGAEIFGGVGSEILTWNSGSITDASLSSSPITLHYSINSGTDWVLIANDLPNSGNFTWNHGILNSDTALIKLVAFDNVGNFANDESDTVFVIDTVDPLLSFNFGSTPVNGSYINNSGFDILANTSDLHFEDSLYTFLDLTTGDYFNGTIFSGSTEVLNNICTDLVVNGTNSSCDLITFNLLSSITDGNDYRLQLKSTDEAGNEILSLPIDYVGDTTNPNITITTASGTFFQNSITIDGTSSDLGSGISSVKIQIKKGTDYWDGASFVGGIQTLNTTTSDNYTNWTYGFSYNGDDGEYEVIAIAYDKSYKVNNTTQDTILVNKDATIPSIIGGTSLFTSPLSGDIYVGGDNMNILWGSGSVSDTGSLLDANPISLEYFNGTVWTLILDGLANDGSHIWNTALIDSNIAKIRLSAIDNIGNITYQSSNTFIIDSTPPNISSIETMDLDANGEIDGLNIIMSENIQDSSIVLGDFLISNAIGTPTSFETGGSANDNTFILRFTNTGDTALRPSVTYTKGSLIDIAGKFLETDSFTPSDDNAVPRLLSTEIFDIDGNGKFDRIISTFSENLTSTTNTIAWSINNALNGLTIDSVSVSGDTVNVFLNEGSDFDTAVGLMRLNFTSNSNWADVYNNQAGSISSGIMNDKAKPVAYQAEYFDLDTDYKVDSVDITFSEDLVGFTTTDFSITGLTKGTGSVTNNVVNFEITETISDNDTGVTSDFTFTTGNLKDSSDNFSDNISALNIDDKVQPKLLSIKVQDYDGNGKIDNVLLSYSEDINSDFSTFVGEVDSYNIASYAKNTNTGIVLNVDEKLNFDTDETPLVRITSNNSIVDGNGNLVSIFSFTAAEDNVGPVIVGARYDEATNKIFIQSSEALESADYLTTSFTLNNAGAYSIVGVDYAEQSITLAGETISYGSTEITLNSDTVGDSLGNKQTVEYFTKISPPIVINEIMLSDTSANNYVELRNLSSSIVDISNYTVAGVTIPGATSISADGYYLISKDTATNSIINIAPDLVDSNLNISGTQLILNNGIMNVDFASLTTGLFDTVIPKSVERKYNAGDGLLTANWYTAQDTVGFDDTNSYGTPGVINVYDPIAPTISTYTPTDNVLLAGGTSNISFNYSDNIGGLGVNITSDNISLVKWDGSVWGANIAGTYINLPGKAITSSSANYDLSGLEFGKYRIDFSISDKAGNTVNKTVIFYVDHFTFSMNTTNIEIGQLISGFNVFSTNEMILTVETVGAGFSIDMIKSALLTNGGVEIIDFDGNYGFGYDQDNAGYSGIITSIGNNVNIATQTQNINTDGDKNTYTYRIKYGAKIDVIQGAGNYSVTPNFEVLLDY